MEPSRRDKEKKYPILLLPPPAKMKTKQFYPVINAAPKRKQCVAGIPGSVRHVLVLEVCDCCSLRLAG